MIQTCYSRDELQAFTLGKLGEFEAKSIEDHLDSCSVCEETVAILDDATDSLLRELRTGREIAIDAEMPGEEEYERAIQELRDADFVGSLSSISRLTADESFEPSRLRDYELLEPLGYGGMGAVYRARHTRLEKLFAVKLLPERRVPDEVAVTRFRREMRAIGQLDHPSIVRATDAGEVDGHHFLAMELVEGADLGRLVRQTGSLNESNASELVRQAAIGMQYAHERGIVHRDLKPSNLMLTNDGSLKILDLGLALLTTGGAGTVDELTTVGQLMGTLDYMAPEQLGDSHAVDQRVDVYSLGATLYKLLTGRAPYSGERYQTPLQKLRGLAVAEPIDIREHVPNISPELADTIHASLARDVEQRIQSSQELAERLETHCQDADLLELWNQRSPNIVPDSSPSPSIIRAPQRRSVSPLTAATDNTASAPSNQPNHGDRRHDGASFAWRTALAFFAASLLGLVFYIQTNRGTLKFESPRDDLTLEVLRAGKPYKSLSLSNAADSWTLGLGDYEVRLKEELDGLSVVNGKFTLRRGEEHVVTISQVPSDPTSVSSTDEMVAGSGQASVSEAFSNFDAGLGNSNSGILDFRMASDVPTYEGLTFFDWRQRFLTERSPKMRGQSAQAMFTLADNADRQKHAIDAALDMTQKERQTKFEDGVDGEQVTVNDLISRYLQEKPSDKLYALRQAMKHGFERVVADSVRTMNPPTDTDTQKVIRELIEAGLHSGSQLPRFAACALRHSNWLENVPEKLRAAAAEQDTATQAHLTLMIVALNRQNENDIRLLASIISRESDDGSPTTREARRYAYAGLLWLGPKAASAADDVLRGFASTRNNGDFYSLINLMGHIRLGLPDAFTDLPEHLNASELSYFVGRDRSRQLTIKDAQVATLAGMGPQAKQAVPTLLEELKTQVARESLTWLSVAKMDNREGLRSNRIQTLNLLAYGLQSIAPERFPNEEAVWIEVLGEKRIPFSIRPGEGGLGSGRGRSNPTWEAVVKTHIEDVLDRYRLDYDFLDARKDEIRVAIADHPAISRCVFNFSSNDGFEFFISYRVPTTWVQADKLYLVSAAGNYVLDPAWYEKPSLERLPIVVMDGLKPVEQNGRMRFDSDQLVDAMSVTQLVTQLNGKSPLTIIRVDPEHSDQFRLENESGTWSIRLGHALAKVPIGEQSFKKKLEALGEVLGELYKGDVRENDRFEADIRFGATIR